MDLTIQFYVLLYILMKIKQEFSHAEPRVIFDAEKVNKTADIDEAQQQLEKVINFYYVVQFLKIYRM